jgi:peptide/nickel transport system substrate-binding protein
VQDPEVGKLQVSTGKVDLSYGPFDALQLADVSTLMKGRKQYGYDVLLWDSGSGTASMVYFSQDYYEPEYRKLFREPKFRQALSHAFNRKQARRAIYFDQGDATTGTISPKGLEFVSSAEGRSQYQAWRDAYVSFDPDKAKALLDQIGVVDRDDDGLRELPSGRKLRLRIELQADAGAEHVQKDTQLVRDWKAIGLDVRLNRVPPLSFNDLWAAGKYMTHSNWEAAGPPNSGLINPLWLAPTESSRWAPLQGAMYATRGTPLEKAERDVDPYKRKPPRMDPERGGPVEKLWDLIDRGATEPDAVKRQALFFEAVKVHVEFGPFYQGTVANYPVVVVVRNGLRNVPTRENLALGGNVNPWEHPTPACYDPESFYWSEPAKHVV